MGFRNPITSVAADQITAGALAPDVVGRALATAEEGRRVVIATSEGDAGRIDFYGDPDGPGNGEGHASLAVITAGGVVANATATLQADSPIVPNSPRIDVGTRDAPAGGHETFITLFADIIDTRPGALSPQALAAPGWTAYVPAVSATSGAFASQTAIGSWMRLGSLRCVQFEVVITSVGTAAGQLVVTLPSAMSARSLQQAIGVGRETDATGVLLSITPVNASTVVINRYDNTSVIASGRRIRGGIVYEVAA